MIRALRRMRGLALAVGLLCGLAACGSSSAAVANAPASTPVSTTSQSISRTSRVTAAAPTSEGQTAASIAAHLNGHLPAGWSSAAAFGSGVLAAFGLPHGWTIIERETSAVQATLVVPVGSPGTTSGTSGGPRPGPVYHGSGAALIAFSPHPHVGVLTPYEVRRATLRRQVRGYRSSLVQVTVPEISDAHLVVESWTGGSDVIILGRTSAGAEFEAIASTQAGHPTFNPVELIESLTLSRH